MDRPPGVECGLLGVHALAEAVSAHTNLTALDVAGNGLGGAMKQLDMRLNPKQLPTVGEHAEEKKAAADVTASLSTMILAKKLARKAKGRRMSTGSTEKLVEEMVEQRNKSVEMLMLVLGEGEKERIDMAVNMADNFDRKLLLTSSRIERGGGEPIVKVVGLVAEMDEYAQAQVPLLPSSLLLSSPALLLPCSSPSLLPCSPPPLLPSSPAPLLPSSPSPTHYTLTIHPSPTAHTIPLTYPSLFQPPDYEQVSGGWARGACSCEVVRLGSATVLGYP
jgi:hypothetical protein